MIRPGVVLPSNVTLRDAERLAAEAEDAGATAIWVTDLRREPYLVAHAALRGTKSVRVGTGVAVAFARAASVTAQAAWDLAGMSGGRFVLGLGSQVGPTLRSRFGIDADRPAARLRDHVRAIRACWDAYRKGRGRYEGEFVTIRQPVFAPGADDPWPADPEIYVAGVNPFMTEVAGEVADGFAAHTFSTPQYLDTVIKPALERGAKRAGGRIKELKGRHHPRVLMPLVVGRTRAELAMQLTTYTVPAYRRVLDESGLKEEADAVLAALADRERTKAAKIVDEKLVDHLGVVLLEDLEDGFARWLDHAHEIALGAPWYGMEPREQTALFGEILRRIKEIDWDAVWQRRRR